MTGRVPIDVLDILRGIAMPRRLLHERALLGGPAQAECGDPRLLGWRPADRLVWSVLQIGAAGTQRGMLELLFGAGMMMLTVRALEPTGPVAVADLYLRRVLWLLAFGLADVFLLLWPDDILHTCALAAQFLFPFHRSPPRALIALGLVRASVVVVGGATDLRAARHARDMRRVSP